MICASLTHTRKAPTVARRGLLSRVLRIELAPSPHAAPEPQAHARGAISPSASPLVRSYEASALSRRAHVLGVEPLDVPVRVAHTHA